MPARALNYTTTISAEKTIGEIQRILQNHGASGVLVRYVDQRPTAVTFTMDGAHGPAAYTLPVDLPAMQALLDRQWSRRDIARKYATPEQAERVAWRTVKDWLEAQLALIAAQQVTMDRVMLPYRHESGMDSPTFYDRFIEAGAKAIEA
jgi:hypothetical protein